MDDITKASWDFLNGVTNGDTYKARLEEILKANPNLIIPIAWALVRTVH